MASPWFVESFDSYGTPPSSPDQAAFRAIWSWDTASDYPGDISADTPHWFQGPFSWKMKVNYFNVRTLKSLIPAIQAVDPLKNAVNGSVANPLVVSFQMELGSGVGTEERVVMWLELVGQDLTTGTLDGAFSSPIKNSGSYGTDPGVCGPANTCTAGWYKMIGRGCARNSDCDTPIWLDFVPAAPGLCTVLNQTLPVPRPALAFGVYAGANGLMPKAEPGDNCSSLTGTNMSLMVAYDGDRWSRLASTAPLGASADTIRTSRFTTDVTLTVRETDFDVTVAQPVACDFAGRCDNSATCTAALPGTCINSVCSNNGATCSADADCNFCSDNTSQHCASDGECRSMTCEGGQNEGTSCSSDAVCVDSSATVCMGGSTDGDACTEAQGTLSATCGRKTITKAHIPRQYTGPFQTIALGPGHVYDGNSGNLYGSEKVGYIDSIGLSGGEFLTMPTGACCMPDGSCYPALQSACTQIAGAFYAGDNVACASARCDAGACCTAQGCVADQIQSECDALGGEFQGRGTNCAGGTCLGACCQPQGACAEAFANTCVGDFRGPGTQCANFIPCCPSPYPDWDGDNDVDMDDFSVLQRCLTTGGGAVGANCSCFDHNHDDVVDQTDVASFIICTTGPADQPGSVAPECEP